MSPGPASSIDADFADDRSALSNELATDENGEFAEGFSRRHLLLIPVIVSFDDFAGDIDSLVAIKDLRALQNQGKLIGFADFVDDRSPIL